MENFKREKLWRNTDWSRQYKKKKRDKRGESVNMKKRENNSNLNSSLCS